MEMKEVMTQMAEKGSGLGRHKMLQDRDKYSIEDLENYRKVLMVVSKMFGHLAYLPEGWERVGKKGGKCIYGRMMGPVAVPPLWTNEAYWGKYVKSFVLSGFIGERERVEKTLKRINGGECHGSLIYQHLDLT